MQYRKFGKLDWQTSVLGFGCMRLPTVTGNPELIDEPLATGMLHYGIDMGINYIDTAYPYHQGQSEPFVGRALKGEYRQKVRLATKMPTWLIQSESDYDKYLDEQLERLQTDHIDFYLLHALNAGRWNQLRDLSVREWSQKAIASGKIGAIGFSFHDEYTAFEQIIKEFDEWDFCQIQYNYMDIEEQAGMRGLHLAAENGLAVVVMEPLLGGKLSNPPDQVKTLFSEAEIQRTPTDWAFQWLWDQPQVTLTLSGMSAMQHVEENILSAQKARFNAFSTEEQSMIDQARGIYESLSPIPCTKCGYCLPCPNGVEIPKVFEIFNKGVMLNNWGSARFQYSKLDPNERADNCLICLECESQCPQQIEISDWLAYVDTVLAQEVEYDGRRQPVTS